MNDISNFGALFSGNHLSSMVIFTSSENHDSGGIKNGKSYLVQ